MKNRVSLILLTVCLLLIPYTVYALSTDQAKEPIDPDAPCTLTLTYASSEAALPPLTVEVYRVAEVSADFRYTLTEAFGGSGLILNGLLSQSEWNTLRTTLDSYVASNGVSPTATLTTDENGVASFADLATGLYYVSPQTVTVDGFRYYFASAVIALPDLRDDGTWNYEITAKPKPDVRPPSSTDLEYRVLKLWKGGEEETRPTEITVDLLKDGTVVKTVTLSEENGWSYSWFAADDGSLWTVAEQNVPEGYTVTVEQNDTVYTVVNTLESSDDSSMGNPGDAGNLNFIILFLCAAGIVLVLLGMQRRKGVEA